MKKMSILFSIICMIALAGCSGNSSQSESAGNSNESTQVIVQEMPFTLEMDDYASQEKVAELTFALPSAVTETPATINAGDLYLWSGNNLVLFYSPFSNSYSYVPVGYIEDVTGLQDALGSGSVEVTFQK